MKIIATIHNDFTAKFGIPRQSGLVPEVESLIVFEPEYRNADALRGLSDFSHLWLIWHFHLAERETWSPTVRPPVLGGNTRVGVFATRSPFRPNPIGLSCVRLIAVEQTEEYGPVIRVAGADLMNGTPLYDIKPYIPYADCHPDATGGFTQTASKRTVEVDLPESVSVLIPPEKMPALLGILRQDPRPAYQDDPDRTYGLSFAGFNLHFRVENGLLTVLDAEQA